MEMKKPTPSKKPAPAKGQPQATDPMAGISYLPIWKEGATAAERFSELAMIAAKHPERFSAVAVLYVEEGEKSVRLRTITSGATTYEALGMLVDAQRRILNGE